MTTGGGTLGRAVLELEADLGGLKRDFNTAERLAKERAKAISRSFRSVGIKLLAAGAGITAVIGLGVKAAVDIEKGFTEVQTLLPKIGDEAFGALEEDVLALSKELGFATNDTIPALYQAISAGVPPQNVISFLDTAGRAAIGGVTDLTTSVDGLTTVVNTYGSDVLSAQQVSDLMFTTIRLGKTTFEELSANLFQVTPVAKGLGIQFDEVSASLAAMTQQGVPTNTATTALRNTFAQAAQDSTKLGQAIRKELGKSFVQLIEKGEAATSVLQRLAEAVPSEEFLNLFTQETLVAATTLFGDSFPKLTSALNEMRSAAGATDAAFLKMSQTTAFQIRVATNNFRITMAELGAVMLPILTGLLRLITPIITAFGNWAKENKTLAKIMVISASIIGVLLIVAGALLLLISLMIPMFTALGLTSAAAWIAMLGPIGLIIAGIVALIAITVLMVKHWDTIKQKAIQIWGAIKDTIKKNWDIILAILFPGVGIAVLIARRWGAIKNVITGILSKITSVVIDFAATLKEILFGLLGVKFFSDLFDNIFGGFLGLKNRLSGALRRVGGGTGGANGEGEGDGRAWWEGTLPVLAWEDFIKPVIWEDFIKGFLWKEIIKPVTNFLWKEIIKPVTNFLWKEIIKPVTSFLWKEIIKPVTSFLWKEIIKPVTSFLWKEIIKPVTSFLWKEIIKPVTSFLWKEIIKPVTSFLWKEIIKPVTSFLWKEIIKGFLWETFIEGFLWETFIKGFLWETFIEGFLWDTVIKDFLWSTVIKDFLWSTFIKPVTSFLWKEIIKPVTSFLWKEIIKPVTSFLWKEIIKPVTSFLWKEIIKPVTSFLWKEIIEPVTSFLWKEIIKPVTSFLWKEIIKPVTSFLWKEIIEPVTSFLWKEIIEPVTSFLWKEIIEELVWSDFIKPLTEKIPLEKLDPRKPENWNPLSEVDWGKLDPRKPENWNPFSEVDWGKLDPRKPENWIPSRDTGGIVTSPQLAALAMNSRPEAIIPLDRLHEFIGNGGGGLTVNVHVSGDVNGVEKLREIIRQGILDGDRRGLEHAF